MGSEPEYNLSMKNGCIVLTEYSNTVSKDFVNSSILAGSFAIGPNLDIISGGKANLFILVVLGLPHSS